MREAISLQTRPNWLRLLVILTVLAMETCWISPWIPLFDEIIAAPPRHHSTLGIYVFLLSILFGGRVVNAVRLSRWGRRGLLTALIGLSTLGMIWAELYADHPLLSFRWMGTLLSSLLATSQRVPPETSLLLMSLYGWHLVIGLSEASLLTETVTTRFRRGFVALALYTLVALISQQTAWGETLGFFFLGTLSIALARLLESGVQIGRWDWGRRWLGLLIGTAALTLALGLLGTSLLATRDFQATRLLLALANEVIGYLLGYLGMLPGYVLDWLLRAVRAFFSSRPLPDFDLPLPPPGGEAVAMRSREPSGTRVFWDPVLMLALGLLTLGVVWVVRRIGRQAVRRPQAIPVEREALAYPAPNGLKGWQQALRAGRRFRLAPRYSTRTIRSIYASMAAYAAALGYPRHEAQTPYEYLATLKRIFPYAQTEVTAITEAYIRVHYGELPETKEELQHVRACWKRLQRREIQRWTPRRR